MGGKTTRMFIKRPVIVEAFQFGIDTVPEWFKAKYITVENGETIACIETLEGDMLFHNGDYVIKGVEGELYPCRKNIFEKPTKKFLISISLITNAICVIIKEENK